MISLLYVSYQIDNTICSQAAMGRESYAKLWLETTLMHYAPHFQTVRQSQ